MVIIMSTGTPINVRQENEAGTGEKPWILVNPYAGPNITFNFIVDGTATFDMQGTLVNPNRETIEADDIFDLGALQNITATSAETLVGQPLVAIRANQTAGTGAVTIQLQQEGN